MNNRLVMWERKNGICGVDGDLWEPIPPRPPRRSLVRWIYDTFLKIGDAR